MIACTELQNIQAYNYIAFNHPRYSEFGLTFFPLNKNIY